MSKMLTEKDFQTAANKLKCEIAAIKAVAEVESKGKGFYSNGFPVILFERHKFHKYSGGKFDKSHPHLSNAKAGGYGPAGANQQRKFNEAFALDPNAALLSCSWGKFQIMGFNYEVCGFASVNDFVDAMKESEGAQLLAFVNFVIGNHLAVYLRRKNWAKFAEGYNGEDYAKNDYDTKMAKAYDKYLKNPADLTKAEKPETQTLPETTKVKISDGEVKVETSNSPPTEKEKIAIVKPMNFFENIWQKITAMVGGNASLDVVTEKAGQVQALGLSSDFWKKLVYFAIAGCLIYLIIQGYRHWQAKKMTAHLIVANTTDSNEVVLVDAEKADEFKAKGYQIITS